MTYQYSIDPTQRLATIRLSDTVTGDEFIQAVTDMLGDERWQPGFNSMWDGRYVTALNLEPERAREFIKRMGAVRDRRGAGKTAVVVARELDYAMARFFSLAIKVTARQINVFRTVEDAQRWLSPTPE
jgi:hypothetical protein